MSILLCHIWISKEYYKMSGSLTHWWSGTKQAFKLLGQFCMFFVPCSCACPCSQDDEEQQRLMKKAKRKRNRWNAKKILSWIIYIKPRSQNFFLRYFSITNVLQNVEFLLKNNVRNCIIKIQPCYSKNLKIFMSNKVKTQYIWIVQEKVYFNKEEV